MNGWREGGRKGYMAGQIGDRSYTWVDRWTGRHNRRWMDAQMEGQTGGLADRWTDFQMDGWMNE